MAMKLRYGTLKRIVSEAMGNQNGREQLILQSALKTAEGYVDSVVAGKRDSEKAEELQAAADRVANLARFLLNKHDPRAEAVAQTAMYIKQVSDASGFWQTPSFLGKDEHAEKLRTAVGKAERSAKLALRMKN
jgi:hypothetical protein